MNNVGVTSSNLIAQAPAGGGAALDQVFGMTAAAGVISLFLLYLAVMHRTRRITWLQRLADYAGEKLHRPGWVALPLVMFISTILTAFFGFIWDVSLHIGRGRDEGPLANPAHYFILVGLFFLFIAGALAIILPRDEKPGPAAIKITRTWYAPTGGLLIAGSGLYALIGFPLDDIWHRMFGQDVTLWGPTHLMLIGGAGLSLVGVLLLEHEGRVAMASTAVTTAATGGEPDGETTADPAQAVDSRKRSIITWFMRSSAFGGLVIGLSVFQIEYDFGVEQFRLVFQPLLMTAAGAFALIAARLMVGRGSALFAVAFAAVIREITALIVGPVLGEPHSVFTLYLGMAVVVEIMGLTTLVHRRLLFGAVTGVAVGTVGLYLESMWVDAVFLYPWPNSMWVEALATCIPAGLVVGLTAGLFAQALSGDGLPRPAVRRSIVVAMVLVLGGSVANGLMIDVPQGASATVSLTDAPREDGFRMVTATVSIDPSDLVSDDPEWVSILAWQGAGDSLHGLVVDNLERTGPGEYRSTRAMPVDGTWKTFLRIQDGRTMAGAPIFMAADEGIGAEEVPATTEFTREFQYETKLLQRERSFDHPAWLFTAACLVVLACSLALIWSLSWGAARISLATPGNTATKGSKERSRV
ncbi:MULTISPECIES: hypothetical protein [unclassified Rhodococcus]|uniref:hypothetical protein n=1 Tax=unclassified Rhodococcus (in: high G+C Gram-positive bacteria) TaxID=192944 RepID=UPI0006F38461|nr:hypothetical protein ASG69_09675 [Rhodococcus sp. Leaf225]KQU46394.1 hypothetical protein ASH03_06710 [Rhodococcus sp. Leaf258]